GVLRPGRRPVQRSSLTRQTACYAASGRGHAYCRGRSAAPYEGDLQDAGLSRPAGQTSGETKMKSWTRPLRIVLIAVVAVVVVIAAVVAMVVARFDPNTYKPDIIAAVKRATGRDLTLNGAISLKP